MNLFTKQKQNDTIKQTYGQKRGKVGGAINWELGLADTGYYI